MNQVNQVHLFPFYSMERLKGLDKVIQNSGVSFLLSVSHWALAHTENRDHQAPSFCHLGAEVYLAPRFLHYGHGETVGVLTEERPGSP